MSVVVTTLVRCDQPGCDAVCEAEIPPAATARRLYARKAAMKAGWLCGLAVDYCPRHGWRR